VCDEGSFRLLNLGAQRLEYKRKSQTYREKHPSKDFIL
jgi:hypothetical protein